MAERKEQSKKTTWHTIEDIKKSSQTSHTRYTVPKAPILPSRATEDTDIS